mgnify:CR=1 FL=1
MTVLVDSSTKVLVQGITGGEDSFHAGQMLEYGPISTSPTIYAASLTKAVG